MKCDMERENAIYPSLFDEDQHPVVLDGDLETPPTVEEIVAFLNNFFELLEVRSSCAGSVRLRLLTFLFPL